VLDLHSFWSAESIKIDMSELYYESYTLILFDLVVLYKKNRSSTKFIINGSAMINRYIQLITTFKIRIYMIIHILLTKIHTIITYSLLRI
jgi:hypothetical protein